MRALARSAGALGRAGGGMLLGFCTVEQLGPANYFDADHADHY